MSTPPQLAAVPFTWRDVATHTWAMWSCASALALLLAIGFFVIPEPASTWAQSRAEGLWLAVMFAAPTALLLVGVLWALAPLTLLIGQRLRNIADPRVHVAVFAATGAVLSLAVLFVWPFPVAALVSVIVSAISAGFGRWWAFRARRRPRRSGGLPAWLRFRPRENAAEE